MPRRHATGGPARRAQALTSSQVEPSRAEPSPSFLADILFAKCSGYGSVRSVADRCLGSLGTELDAVPAPLASDAPRKRALRSQRDLAMCRGRSPLRSRRRRESPSRAFIATDATLMQSGWLSPCDAGQGDSFGATFVQPLDERRSRRLIPIARALPATSPSDTEPIKSST